MKKTVVISEFDPFTNGHAYLASRAKTEDSLLIAIMSGGFTQRGSLACGDKFARAEAAIAGGFDAVIELPPPFAVATAERFARGGIAVARLLGADTLVCGVETEDRELLSFLATLTMSESEDVSLAIQQKLRDGLSFPRARVAALTEYLNTHGGERLAARAEKVLTEPNSLLAIEYIKAAGSDIRVCPVRRIGSEHNGETDPAYLSAGAVRERLENGEALPEGAIPPYSMDALKKGVLPRTAVDSILLYALRVADEEVVKSTADCPEALADILLKNRMKSLTMGDLVARCVNKTYTASRIRRAITSLALGHTDELYKVCLASPCAFLLAAKSREVLSELGDVLITQASDFERGGVCMNSILNADILRASGGKTDPLTSYKRKLF